MVLGHGIDLVEVSEIERLVSVAGWLARCFEDEEISSFPQGPTRLAHIAGRFAAKEAVLKALGSGFGNGVAFTNILVERSEGAPPTVRLQGGALAVANKLGIKSWHLSISHTKTLAFASVIAIQ